MQNLGPLHAQANFEDRFALIAKNMSKIPGHSRNLVIPGSRKLLIRSGYESFLVCQAFFALFPSLGPVRIPPWNGIVVWINIKYM